MTRNEESPCISGDPSGRFLRRLPTLIVDVAARYAIRNLIVNMERAQIQWRWDDGYLKLYDAEKSRWIIYNQSEMHAANGYNKNIGEDMYIEELKSFVHGITENNIFPNTLDDDIKVLTLLKSIEDSDEGF
jgi:hypothetical protein